MFPKGININELYLHTKLPSTSPTGEVWRGKWQGNEIAAKVSRQNPLSGFLLWMLPILQICILHWQLNKLAVCSTNILKC